MLKVKKGDTVQVLSGNDKGKKGEVLEKIMIDFKKLIAEAIAKTLEMDIKEIEISIENEPTLIVLNDGSVIWRK